LGGTVKDMSDLPPVNQVTAMEDRESGKIFECGGNEIIILVNPANGRVRITS
jgi:hypothetical protein